MTPATPDGRPVRTRFRGASRTVPGASLAATLVLSLSGCLSATGTDNSGQLYAQLRGTVTRENGTVVPRAEIGVSCTGSAAIPFGVTNETDANGRFDFAVTAPVGFTPLEGTVFLCRVLTPLTGVPLAQKTVSVRFGATFDGRPVTEASLVVP